MFSKVLIANRGAVAARIQRAVHALGGRTVVVHSEADAGLPYVAAADEAYCIGPPPALQSYLDIAAVMDAVKKSGADAVHPGYGFLSEKAAFAHAVAASGATFIGPDAKWLEALGHKTRARELMSSRGMPVAPSSDVLIGDLAARVAQARAIGFPLLVKPAGGGGGIGMIAVKNEAELGPALERAAALAQKSFACDDVYVERLLEKPRHVEFQIIADRHGNAMHLYERDCSVQRRHQKVIEEAGAPSIPRDALDALAERAASILGTLGYDSIGTVETLHDPDAGFSFLEVNTRLQVEHGVTEEVTGIDIVQTQIRLAAGERLAQVIPSRPALTGHALQVRIYAEDPVRFFPSPGTLTTFEFPQGPGIRVETGYAQGAKVTPHYDPLIAKLIVRGTDRADAIARAQDALSRTRIEGLKTNIPFAEKVLRFEAFRNGQLDTGIAARVLAG
jgi:acetyl-CoA carboxylase biotin carboxylase subunit